MTKDKIYLGDSVYAEISDGVLRLWTDNGYGPENAIFLEPEVIRALMKYAYPSSVRIVENVQRACNLLRSGGPSNALAVLEEAMKP